MKIKKARALGFCFGVRRAIEVVERGVEEYGPIDSLGSIVHNPEVVKRLAAKGINVVNGLEHVRTPTVAITAHGARPEVMQEAAARGLRLVDATCPIVRKLQKMAQRLQDGGFQVLIYGDEDHPEVRAVLAWTNGDGSALPDPEAPLKIQRRKVALLSQTTKSEESFTAFVAKFMAKHVGRINELRIINTICPETEERYRAARELAKECDLLIVVGGRNSANTRKLVDTCAATGVETHHVETAAEVEPAWLVGKDSVGVAAGASTPDESIDQVVQHLEQLANQRREAVNERHLGLSGVRFSFRSLVIRTDRGPQFIDITDGVASLAEESAIRNGFAIVFTRHTTAAIRINENEPLLLHDMEEFLKKVAPARAYYSHNDFAHRTANMTEGEQPNGHSHCQQLLLGASEAIPIVDGQLLLGQWQRLFLVELDRAREREVVVQLMGE
ncbi:MAG: 4-hydroxy-3-methylbut-2-enyl diphosphate reductase [Dehalococcoidia bacterium]